MYGNLYLTEKRDGQDFDADDERALALLAAQAGVARERQPVRGGPGPLPAAGAVRAITTAILANTDSGEVLGMIVRHARELVGLTSRPWPFRRGPTGW